MLEAPEPPPESRSIMALGSLITSTLTHPPCTSHTAFASACKRSSAARSAVTLDPPDPHAAQLAPPFRSAAYKSFCRCDAPDGWSACKRCGGRRSSEPYKAKPGLGWRFERVRGDRDGQGWSGLVSKGREGSRSVCALARYLHARTENLCAPFILWTSSKRQHLELEPDLAE